MPLHSPRATLALLVGSPLVLAAALGAGSGSPSAPCAPDNGGLTLPEGLCATVVASDADGVRQLAAGPGGELYAAIQGRSGPGVLALRDRDGDGNPEEREAFGPAGGNDVEVRNGYLYLALPDRILRWGLVQGRLAPAGEPETIVAELPDDGNHTAKSLAFEGTTMLVNIGSATNSCQENDRQASSPGRDPCRELERRAGIWAFDAERPGQRFADGKRWATGLRNASALTVQPGTGAVYAAVHGRDQLGDNWGFSDRANADNPAEELVRVEQGDDFGWPYCYFSNAYEKKVLAPEYGGDGRKVGRCAAAKNPVIAFPGHWAPLALAFHLGSQLGDAYQGGLFIAFHGSWNRAPLPQAGYRVVFAPFENGKATGQYETFATGANPTDLRASGLAVAADGGLFISADANGKIWKVVRREE